MVSRRPEMIEFDAIDIPSHEVDFSGLHLGKPLLWPIASVLKLYRDSRKAVYHRPDNRQMTISPPS